MQFKYNKNKRKAVAAAGDVLDIKSLFPRSKIDLRKSLNKYQYQKIQKHYKRIGGNNQKNAVKIRRTKAAKKWLKKSGTPAARVVIIPGGNKINKNVRITKRGLEYDRGNTAQTQYPVNMTSVGSMERDITAHIMSMSRNETAHLMTPGGRIQTAPRRVGNNYIHSAAFAPQTPPDTVDGFLNTARDLYDRYASMSLTGEKRTNGRLASHPSKWGMTLLIEGETKK